MEVTFIADLVIACVVRNQEMHGNEVCQHIYAHPYNTMHCIMYFGMDSCTKQTRRFYIVKNPLPHQSSLSNSFVSSMPSLCASLLTQCSTSYRLLLTTHQKWELSFCRETSKVKEIFSSYLTGVQRTRSQFVQSGQTIIFSQLVTS